MKKKNEFEITCESIKKGFNDHREIVAKSGKNIQEISEKHNITAEIYETKDGSLISFGLIDKDIDNREIEKIIKYGEELYEKSEKIVSIYIIGTPDVTFNVTKDLESKAELIIKFMPTPYSEAYDVLRHLKDMLKRREKFDEDDLHALSMVPLMGPPEDRRNLRIECLKIWQKVMKKGLVK